MVCLFFFKQKTAYEMRISGLEFRRVVFRAGWRIETTAGPVLAQVLVNAAGAWADEVARACGVAPIGIQPLRRTVVQLRTDPAPPRDLPLIIDIEEHFYFKVEGTGRLWLTPHDEAPAPPIGRASCRDKVCQYG